jgi:putative aldouronate transport system permease protein
MAIRQESPWFSILNGLFLFFFLLTILYPLWYLLMLSLSTFGGINSKHFIFLFTPAGFTTEAYTSFFRQKYIHTGYGVTIFRTVIGTLSSVFLMALAGYALSKKTLPGRKIITTYFIFTMFFNGGIIPTYLLVRSLHLLNNIWILVLIPMFSAYYILILRSYFSGIPNEILEAAKIDGAGELRTFFQIVTPLSIPALITIGTWMFFNHWNAWFDCLLYIQDINKQVVQIHIRRIVIEQSQLLLAGVMQIGVKANMPTEESIRAAGIMITIVPVLIIYPFVKRFFVKGATLGAVKG